MKNSVSERSLYIESDEEDMNDEEEVYGKGGEDENGHDSDSSESPSIGSPQQNRPSPYNTSWPQSYSLSIKTSSPDGQAVGYNGNGLATPPPPANG